MRETHKNRDNDGVINPNPEKHEKKNSKAIFNPSKSSRFRRDKPDKLCRRRISFLCLLRFSLSISTANNLVSCFEPLTICDRSETENIK
jgi:hypothetical protein